jgi:hypothetical protein
VDIYKWYSLVNTPPPFCTVSLWCNLWVYFVVTMQPTKSCRRYWILYYNTNSYCITLEAWSRVLWTSIRPSDNTWSPPFWTDLWYNSWVHFVVTMQPTKLCKRYRILYYNNSYCITLEVWSGVLWTSIRDIPWSPPLLLSELVSGVIHEIILL